MKRLFILLCFITYKSWSCTCMEPYYFNFKDAGLHPIFESNLELIVLASVISFSDDGYFMEIRIVEEIKHSILNETLIVAGQDGMNCAQTLHSGIFNLSDTVILRLTDDFYNRKDTLELSDCSLNFLRYDQGIVKGNITESDTVMNYQEFKLLIDDDPVNSIGEPGELKELLLFPNPVNNYLKIRNRSESMLDINFIDITGHSCKRIHGFSTGAIDLTDLRPGIYIVNISDSRKKSITVEQILKE